jgi:hypothetical protein
MIRKISDNAKAKHEFLRITRIALAAQGESTTHSFLSEKI